MPSPDRRQLLAATVAIASAAPVAAAAQPPAAPIAPRPLPLDPKAITGLSEQLLVSHYENNYAGAVRRLGAIEAQLSALDPGAAPGFTLNGLKREELIAWNSMILHELYFASLGVASRPGAPLAAALERDFGSHDRWRAEFSATAKALGGGSGWVILAWSRRDGRLMNQWAADHTMSLAMSDPVLVVDMYEHAYHLDYGARAAEYVDAVMRVLDWRQADARFARASA
jgi:Fe-Mn family superoxide dismutase